MGATESNSATGELPTQSIEIPPSLRSVFPFLYDAQRCFLNAHSSHYAHNAAARGRIAISNINKAFGLLTILNLDLDGDALACLDKFRLMRSQMYSDLGVQIDVASAGVDFVFQPGRAPYPSHEILIAEVSVL
jgi:hypothetical protein